MANAARLGGLAVAGLLTFAVGGLALFGQLDDVVSEIGEGAGNQLARAGFAVQAVDVTGAYGADAHAIVAATELHVGDPIFAVDPARIRDRVEALPGVRAARVARLLPNRVAVVVETREAYALWQVEGALNVIDREGVVQHQVVNNLPLGRNVDEIIRLVDALQFTEEHGEVCPAGWRKGQPGMKADAAGVADYLNKHADSL